MHRFLYAIIFCSALWPALRVSAHPHIFIDAGLNLILNETGTVIGVDVTWRYDELYTLILLQDYGLDQDFDLALTDQEINDTLGFDLNWGGGFEGGLTITQNGQDLGLGAPVAVSLDLLPTGQLQTTHHRVVVGAAPGGVMATIYDPEFYIAFEMTLPHGATGAMNVTCQPELIRADLDAAYAILEQALNDIGGSIDAEDNFPPVGADFADEVRFTCVL
jgi:ABC-type uncharacterized transport system substrate-binding protein